MEATTCLEENKNSVGDGWIVHTAQFFYFDVEIYAKKLSNLNALELISEDNFANIKKNDASQLQNNVLLSLS